MCQTPADVSGENRSDREKSPLAMQTTESLTKPVERLWG